MILSPSSGIMLLTVRQDAGCRCGKAPGRKEEVDMKESQRKKKMVAPVLITVFFLVYLAAYGIAIGKAAEWSPLMLLAAVPLVALGAGMVYILRTRIKEIRSGEEDDLGNY